METRLYRVYVTSDEGFDSETYLPIVIVDGVLELTEAEAIDLTERLSRLQKDSWIGDNSFCLPNDQLVLESIDSVFEAIGDDWSGDEETTDLITKAWNGVTE